MIGNLIAVISASAAIIAALVAYSLYRITRRNLVYQVLVNLQMEYRSPKMQYAIWKLWDFYKEECKEDEETLMRKYGETYNEEKDSLKKPQDKPIEALEIRLDHQRRLVKLFYSHLAALYANKIVPTNIVFKIWPEDTLRIIPKIIIPLDKKMCELTDTKPPEEDSDLHQLYIDSKDYE